MELQTLYDTIERYALNTQTVVSYKTGDPYVLLNSLHIDYPIFVSILNYVRYQENIIEYHLTFYMVYKLENNSSNIYRDQDNAFKVIRNVINHLIEEFGLDGFEIVEIRPFTQKFSDLCCGAYADVVVTLPMDDLDCDGFDKE